jgi:predicted dehydrogenase
MSEREIKVGLLGLGQMGRNHLRVLSLLKGVDVGFVYDANQAHAEALAAQHGLMAASDPVAAAAEVDAVLICTPTATHADYVEQLAPHVGAMFVEKPLAHSLAAARAIEAAVARHQVLVQVGFIERFNPAIIALDRVLRDSDRVINIDFTRTNRLSARITDVDVIMDLMIHDIDLALHLNGPVAHVTGQGVVENGLIEFASAQLTHTSGRFSRLQASRITEKKLRLIEATCTDRFIDCDLLRKEIVIHRQSVTQQSGLGAYSITSNQEAVAVGQQEALLTELQAFAQAVRERHDSGVPGFSAGVESLAVAEAIGSAIGAGRA